MAEQSRYIDHIQYNEVLDSMLDVSDIDVVYDNRSKIEDLNLFKRKLVEDNLMTPQLSEFIDNYIKFYND